MAKLEFPKEIVPGAGKWIFAPNFSTQQQGTPFLGPPGAPVVVSRTVLRGQSGQWIFLNTLTQLDQIPIPPPYPQPPALMVLRQVVDGKWQRPLLFIPRPQATAFSVSGQTLDKLGNALGGCKVDLFHAENDVKCATVISDGSGNFSFYVGIGEAFYARAYLAGAPDVAGTTRNDVAGTMTVNVYLKDPTTGSPGTSYSRSRVANMSG